MMWRILVTAVVLSACAGSSRPGSDPSATGTPTARTSAPADAATPAPAAAGTASPSSPSPDPTAGPTSPTDEGDAGVLPEGFELTAARATAPDGTVCELCLWLADDADQRRRGLMFVTDLGPADGMAFRYPTPHTGRFWMKNTVLPLSIAFFDPTGAFLEAFDMEPCTVEPCRRHPTPRDFLVALETTQGDLDRIGVVPGSTLELLDRPCVG